MNGENTPRRWDKSGKHDAVCDVLRLIISKPPEFGQRCLEQDSFARQLFEDPEIGNISVPDNVRVVFLPVGERDKGEKGSIVLELPPTEAVMSNPLGYIRYPTTAATKRRTWDNNGKALATIDVLGHLTKNPELRQYCLRNDTYTRGLFQDNDIGRIDIPEDVKTVFVPTGEDASQEYGSLVIELPESGANVDESDLILYVLCCYHLW